MSRPRGAGAALAAALLALATLAPAAAGAPRLAARLSAGNVPVGGGLELLITVSDPGGQVGDPQFQLPDGIEQLGTSREQSFSLVNGRASTQVTFRIELGADAAGRYVIGPIRIAVGGQTFVSGALPLTVAGAAPGAPGGGRGPASLIVTADPPRPYVGQLVRLRVQLVQRQDLSGEGEYEPPSTAGFWTESWGDATVYRAREGNRQVLVTERAQRLYPLAPGTATIGIARATVTVASAAPLDPFQGGGLADRPIETRSDSFHVHVRPLPPGAPAAFDGAVGTFHLSWHADREHTAQDQAITGWLEVRGTGNLPLLHTPAYAPADFEVFAGPVEDSLPPAGQVGVGRRRFQWTLMPRRAGRLDVPPPAFAWFDPTAERYVSEAPPPLPLEVLAVEGASAADLDTTAFPPALGAHPAAPGSRPAAPWAAALAGLALGAGVALWRRGGRPDAEAGERARQREWLRAVGLAHGPDFWRAADEAADWLQRRGAQVLRLREDIAAARYGRQLAAEDEVRRRLVERLGEALPAPPSPWTWRLAAVVLALAGLAGAWLARPGPGDERLMQRARMADDAARAGRVDAATAEWRRLWTEGPGDAPLAARLAWAALQRGDVGGAALWALRGQQREARDPTITWIEARAREAGGMLGAPGRALPLRSGEWAALAGALGLAAALLWRRPRLAAPLALLAAFTAVEPELQAAWNTRAPLAVVRAATPLAGADVQLEPGQVVRVRGRRDGAVRVRAGRDLEGGVPPGVLSPVDEPAR